MLVIDTSNSMSGERFEAAQNAAYTFLDTVPDDVYVGIVSFDSDVNEALAPSLDRDAARDVVEGLDLSQQTRLYDGVQLGLDVAGTEGQRQLLVLSDGADTSDTAARDHHRRDLRLRHPGQRGRPRAAWQGGRGARADQRRG